MFSSATAAGLAGGPNVEANDDRLGGDGEVDVALGDGPDGRVDDREANLLARELRQRIGDRLDRPLHVALDDDAQLLLAAVRRSASTALRANTFAPCRDEALRHLALRLSAISCAFFGSLTASIWSPALGTSLRPRISTGVAGAGLVDLLAVLVGHRADLAEPSAREDEVSDVERPILDEHASDRAASAIEQGLQNGAARRALRVRLQFEQLALELDGLEKLRYALASHCAHVHELSVTAPVLGYEALVDELALDAFGIGPGLVDFVDRHDERDLRRLRVRNGLLRLRHDAVISGHDEDHDVGHAGPASAHLGERFVSRSVEKHDGTQVGVDLVGADVLRDAAGLSGGNVGLAEFDRASSSCRGRRVP